MSKPKFLTFPKLWKARRSSPGVFAKPVGGKTDLSRNNREIQVEMVIARNNWKLARSVSFAYNSKK